MEILDKIELDLDFPMNEFFLRLDGVADSSNQYSVKASLRATFPQLLPNHQFISYAYCMSNDLFEAASDLLRKIEAEDSCTHAPDWTLLKHWGAILFTHLIPPNSPVEDLWRKQPREHEIRFLLECQPNRLANIPWELAFDLINGKFLSLSCHFLRHFSKPTLPQTSNMINKLLAVSSNPYYDLETEREIDECHNLWDELFNESAVVRDPSPKQLLNTISSHRPKVFHYAGHSSLTPKGGRVHLRSSNQKDHTEDLPGWRLAYGLQAVDCSFVFFNSCLSGQYQGSSLLESIVKSGILNVVAMNQPVLDDAAIQFSKTFYASLLYGHSLEQAITHARLEVNAWLSTPSIRWGLPVATFVKPNLRLRGKSSQLVNA